MKQKCFKRCPTRNLDETLCTRRRNGKCFAVTNEPRKNEQRENRVCDPRENEKLKRAKVSSANFALRLWITVAFCSRQPATSYAGWRRSTRRISCNIAICKLHSRKIVALSFSMRDIHSPVFNRARKMSTMSLQIYADVVMIRCASRDLPYTR